MSEFIIKYTIYKGLPKEPSDIVSNDPITTEHKCDVVEAETAKESVETLIEENEFKINIEDITKI